MLGVTNMEQPLPPPAPFVPLATMFKLVDPDSSAVECVKCGTMFPLSDLLSGELEEDECPRCLTTSGMYWTGKPHRKVDEE